jgi:hypothetical protein
MASKHSAGYKEDLKQNKVFLRKLHQYQKCEPKMAQIYQFWTQRDPKDSYKS